MTTDFSNLRREYRHVELLESHVDADPFVQFGKWFDDACAAEIELPNAMVLATANADGRPSARFVLMKAFSRDGFVFYTHAGSLKGRQMAENPRAALVFYWSPLHRQVRVEGTVVSLGPEQADEYFSSRPYGSRISARVAVQSSEVESRTILEERWLELKAQFPESVPRPDDWIGYRVEPEVIEFWQGREDRLHDRICYSRGESGGWDRRRLAP